MALFEQHEIDKARACDILHIIEGCGVELKKAGHEYIGLCPFHSEDSPSFSVVRHKGFYHCFGCGANGNAIGFLEKYRGLKFPEAVGQLLGRMPATFIPPPPSSTVVRDQEPDVWEFLSVAPDADSLQQPDNTIRRNIDGTWHELECAARYPYRNIDGSLMGYILRYNRPDGRKEVIPSTYWKNRETGDMRWITKAFPKPGRPMYGLDKLARNPKAQVIVVEGEKACDAAQAHFIAAGLPESKLVVVTWPGGAQAVKHVDLSPLHGRRAGLLPDADQKDYPERHPQAGERMPFLEQPGTVAMLNIAERIAEHCPEPVKLFIPPAGVPDGWDLADEFPDGFDLREYLKNKGNHVMVNDLRDQVATMRAALATPSPTPGGKLDVPAGQKRAANDAVVDAVPKFTLVHGSEVCKKAGPISWLVRGIVETEALAILYGEPGCGKSFWTLELGLCIAFGIDFHRQPVKQGAVIYVAGEGHNGIGRRIAAFEIKHGVKLTQDVPFYVSERSASLADKNSARDVSEVIFRTCEAAGGIVPVIVLIDTFGRNLGPFDENQAEAVNMFTANVEHYLQKRWKATILIVHHSGKDASKGARGSSALKANVDTQYCMVKGDDKIIRLHCDKMKDGPEPPDRAYQLESVPLGFVEEDGTAASGAVLKPIDWTEGPQKGKQGQGNNQLIAYQALVDLEEENARTLDDGGFNQSGARVTLDEWVSRMKDGLCFDRNQVWRAKRDLLRDEKVVIDGPHIRTNGLFA